MLIQRSENDVFLFLLRCRNKYLSALLCQASEKGVYGSSTQLCPLPEYGLFQVTVKIR